MEYQSFIHVSCVNTLSSLRRLQLRYHHADANKSEDSV